MLGGGIVQEVEVTIKQMWTLWASETDVVKGKIVEGGGKTMGKFKSWKYWKRLNLNKTKNESNSRTHPTNIAIKNN